jgi:predicted RNA binding protein YcfA (HicA-like mRNA interferase family)
VPGLILPVGERIAQLAELEVVRALEQAGFKILCARGSHSCLRHPDGRTTIIPVPGGETLGSEHTETSPEKES